MVEIKEIKGEGYFPVIDYSTWRVAVLNYCDELLPQNINKMQRHDESDEVFVLLKGRFMLYAGDGKDTVGNINSVELEPYKVYNVHKGTWHTHSLSRDASVLIIENKDTGDENSPEIELDDLQKSRLISLWTGGR